MTTGQIVFNAFTIGKQNIELEVTWVEDRKGKEALKLLVGRNFEFPTRVFPKSQIRPGRGTNEHKVTFDKMDQDITLEEGGQYAALISWEGDPRLPFILGVGLKADFDKVTAYNKVVAEGKKVLHVVEDENLYEVTILDRRFRGTLSDIVTKATQDMGDDPVAVLSNDDLTIWKKKGDDDKYHACSVPSNIPPANPMLVTASAKKIAAKTKSA